MLNRLREIRKKNNVSADIMSMETGYSRASIYKWEAGYIPKLIPAIEIAKYLNSSVEELFGVKV